MDQELKQYLDEKFGAIGRKVSAGIEAQTSLFGVASPIRYQWKLHDSAREERCSASGGLREAFGVTEFEDIRMKLGADRVS
jgi:hypothetical protein